MRLQPQCLKERALELFPLNVPVALSYFNPSVATGCLLANHFSPMACRSFHVCSQSRWVERSHRQTTSRWK